jgi:hypothetical protein
MRVKHLATKNTMAKTSFATSWVRSAITKKEVEKARADDLISAQDSIKFPSTERIPEPPERLSGNVPCLPSPQPFSSCP